ncbi:hypothetical protein CQA49_09710 [Helicobacter sp. MIT 00-7814]|uniref:hypothetical protein n=1 Tax=unclassified Helicobacter TaxID=2593540 RepID=UPI000E1E58EA|nr:MULTISPECIES: hypothetical protein [unclassified Helicobacter]RDU51356.1 hypothetical protein CQA49_09710 [Helicobacter sp. MIT 00-7814]RDU51462.1 hypothetical protein CQA37_09710 [Helicobacter sp. MIT 99-10781]
MPKILIFALALVLLGCEFEDKYAKNPQMRELQSTPFVSIYTDNSTQAKIYDAFLKRTPSKPLQSHSRGIPEEFKITLKDSEQYTDLQSLSLRAFDKTYSALRIRTQRVLLESFLTDKEHRDFLQLPKISLVALDTITTKPVQIRDKATGQAQTSKHITTSSAQFFGCFLLDSKPLVENEKLTRRVQPKAQNFFSRYEFGAPDMEITLFKISSKDCQSDEVKAFLLRTFGK